MAKPTLLLALAALLLPAPALPLAAWGHLGHKLAARTALKELPPELAAWFAGQEARVGHHANDPDFWKGRDPQEGPRHFLDCEAYGGPAGVPLDEAAARAQIGPELFQKSGQVPWVILARVQRLRQAFAGGDPGQVALEAAFLSHYVADCSVPLHTTRNYNGDDSGQHGVHRRWEEGLLKRIVTQEDWLPEVRPALPGAAAEAAPMAWLQASYALVPGVLAADRAAEREAGGDEGQPEGDGYWQAFLQRQRAMVKAQLSLSAQRTAEMILLAWTQAGQPQAPRLQVRLAPHRDVSSSG